MTLQIVSRIAQQLQRWRVDLHNCADILHVAADVDGRSAIVEQIDRVLS